MSELTDKSVKITEEQREWIEENAINFSKWVRMKLEDEIKDED